MVCKKANEKFDVYNLEMSFAELLTFRDILDGKPVRGLISDGLRQALTWYFQRLPAPGEDKKKGKDGEGVETRTIDPKPQTLQPAVEEPGELPPADAEFTADTEEEVDGPVEKEEIKVEEPGEE